MLEGEAPLKILNVGVYNMTLLSYLQCSFPYLDVFHKNRLDIAKQYILEAESV